MLSKFNFNRLNCLQVAVILFLSLILFSMSPQTFAQGKKVSTKSNSKNIKWEARFNNSLFNKSTLVNLMQELDDKFPIMAFVVASQSLKMVEDTDLAKEAFKQITNTIDKGFPFSLMDFFIVGNLKLNDYDYYSQSYNFYKGVLAKNKDMQQWSEDFFKLIDKTNFNRYKYYEMLNNIQEKKFDEAKEGLRELLKIDHKKTHYAFVKKVARTLARLHFTLKEYDAAKEIYVDFLLKLNPITYRDWVELAWVQYYLKDFSAALGSLVNLEGHDDPFFNMESYIIKASIYKQLCDDKSVKKLSEDFNSKYSELISQVQFGKLINPNGLFVELLASVSSEFAMINFIEKEIKKEFKLIESDGKITNKKLVKSLFESEMKRLNHTKSFYFEKYKTKAISKIVDTSESLHFLSFSAARERYNPKYVFGKVKDKLEFFNFNKNKNRFILWRHNGSFFKDERLNYQVELFDQCDHY